ncbi:transposase [Enterococcus faecalis]|uniref:transposase n=1 Tax=Enterococcus faecalis TaxID=1351 RepID=UPI002DBBD4DD|nr:transposase [Enterococcus faecalis]MEB7792180.1 IS110 family transposase [Enterococcus faecalis]MEB7810199.1 IS110 family transposase [Enterococcus faecalis]
MDGISETLGPQLIAEIVVIQRFAKKQSLVAFSGLDAPFINLKNLKQKNRRISKRDSSNLRKTFIQVMTCLL